MQTQAFLSSAPQSSDTVSLELSVKLHNYPKPDRESVKLLVIGSKAAVNVILHNLHYRRFAEVFEWTDFLPAPTAERPIQSQPGEVMKVLVKYLPRQ
ncbi:hypothetical protein [Sphaerothrix gracilis]|uniref:hypothetical protein n=1 Tax=Sphaerothrix gracilis TaxID=3151835 RepID=UPI0031FCC4CF